MGAFDTTGLNENGEFGASLAVEGNRALVGAPGEESAYVFERVDGQWRQQARLVAADASSADRFGDSVALDGERALIGAPRAGDGEKIAYAGWAYVFERRDGAWTQQAVFASGESGDRFGRSVALDSGTALVGAPRDRGPDGYKVGSAYVFSRSGEGWTRETRLSATNRESEREFGSAVALDSGWAVVGSKQSDCDEDSCAAGRAHVFEHTGGAWTRGTTLRPEDGEYDGWGTLVALDGETLLVGARADDRPSGNHAGTVAPFERVDGEWTRQATLSPHEYIASEDLDELPKTHSSNTVAIDGERALVSITVELSEFNVEPSATFVAVFERTAEDWDLQTRLVPDEETRREGYGDWPFGASLALTADSALVGDPVRQTVYVFWLDG